MKLLLLGEERCIVGSTAALHWAFRSVSLNPLRSLYIKSWLSTPGYDLIPAQRQGINDKGLGCQSSLISDV